MSEGACFWGLVVGPAGALGGRAPGGGGCQAGTLAGCERSGGVAWTGGALGMGARLDSLPPVGTWDGGPCAWAAAPAGTDRSAIAANRAGARRGAMAR